ncbi:hypothetical protein GCM10027299_45230 [Larkinella ripae]
MKKIILALGVSWAVLACQQPDVTITPTNPLPKPEPSTSLGSPIHLPDGVEWEYLPTVTPFQSVRHGQVIFASCLNDKTVNGQLIRITKLFRYDPVTKTETLLKTFTGHIAWNVQDGNPPMRLLNEHNSLTLNTESGRQSFLVRYYGAYAQQLSLSSAYDVTVKPLTRYRFTF